MKVLVAVRDPGRAEEALSGLKARPGHLETLELELASVRRAAARVLTRTPELELLINNAGTMATPSGRPQTVSRPSSAPTTWATSCSRRC
ncbi:hypothetical protein [Deinococcus sp.]|uniref:hypothetical protein n=1 Tax=Deinococcus sp. TaxID=47478 RepID=UPI003C7A11D3